MRFILLLLVFIAGVPGCNRIAKINELKSKAESAVANKAYKEAIDIYTQLTDTLQVREEELTFNRSQIYYLTDDIENAKINYNKLVISKDNIIRSESYLQLGIIAYKNKEAKAAMDYFKNSLRANSNNEKARYNYELLKKIENAQSKAQNKEQDSPQQEPSDFAKKVKEKAERLVSQNRYKDALKLMEDSKQIDSTINAYNNFIQRLHTVVEIDK